MNTASTTAIAAARPWPWPGRLCGGSDGGSDGTGGRRTTQPPTFNAAVTRSSTRPTRRAARSRSPSPTTGTPWTRATRTTAFTWDFTRNYARPLHDLQGRRPARRATSSSPTSPRARACRATAARPGPTRSAGLKYEDGTPITSKDVKYAIERSADKDDVPQRPEVLQRVPRRRGLQGPTRTEPDKPQGDRDAGRPDHRLQAEEAVRRLRLPRQLPQTAPVPKAKDTGAKYQEHPISTGPYKFETYDPGKKIALVRNDRSGTRPPTRIGRKALPDKIEVDAEGQRQRHRQAAACPVSSTSTSTAPACRPSRQAKILGDPDQKQTRTTRRHRGSGYTVDQHRGPAVRQHRVPQGRHVRRRPEGYQRACGGPTGGDIATNDAAAEHHGLREGRPVRRRAPTTAATSPRPRRR